DAGPDAACERDHRDRDVVEVADPETGHLEDHKADEDAQVQGDRGQDQKTPWKSRSRHSDHTLRRGRRRRVPRSSDRRIGSRMLMVETDVLGTGRAAGEETPAPDVSLVVTLYNEVDSLPELYRRTVATLDPGPHSYELIFVDDGSTDGTFAALERLHEEDPRVRGVRFKRNFGQHPAMHAGLARARGDIVVTMDGDLQNAPEDIPRLLEAVEAGNDVASGRRGGRPGFWGRSPPSRVVKGLLPPLTRLPVSVFGCAFHPYPPAAVPAVLR